MNTAASAPPGISLEIPAHLRANFEKAEACLRKSYGASPPVHDLIRLWLACASSLDIVREFEEGVLEIKGSTLRRTDEGDYDEQALDLWANSVRTRSNATGDQPPRSPMAGER